MPSDLSLLLLHAVPAVFLLAALAAGRAAVAVATAWRRAQLAAGAAAAIGGMVLLGGRPSAATVVAALVAFLGWVITRYASTYLAGEPGQQRFVRWLLLTLAGSSLVAATENLALLAVAWLGASLALGNLLTFYGDRPAAQMAAHKKFLVSRTADGCMLVAWVLLAAAAGTLHLPTLLQFAGTGAPLPGTVQVAVLLVAVAVLLKAAQLPFHGWLMQVMEAPTPVSALLHAGVVNLGGFVLIRLAPLVDGTPTAQALLVVVGSATAATAALVASTRISVKVALAWSTCAQMGFMVLQCGLGLHEMALLHLVGHSLYKAHSFLAAGSAVQQSIVRAMTPATAPATVRTRALAAVGGIGVAFAASWLLGVRLLEQPGLLAIAAIVGVALAPLLVGGHAAAPSRRRLRGLGAAFAVAAAYFGLHRLLHGWLGIGAASTSVALAAWTIGCFALLFAAQAVLAARPHGAFARRLHAWFYGGLFLDEWFTRLTLRLWPVGTGTSPVALAHTPRPETLR
ncbi:MAG: NADH-quinone oxidoreductase subunit L [Planctomycetes bacterium]|nr:NADH-quinone oxidoreductase subunit L [Planctomycetota bacterium]